MILNQSLDLLKFIKPNKGQTQIILNQTQFKLKKKRCLTKHSLDSFSKIKWQFRLRIIKPNTCNLLKIIKPNTGEIH